MELRWVYYRSGDAPLGASAIHLGAEGQQFALVLQYRDGVTRDAPWQNVPMHFPEIAP